MCLSPSANLPAVLLSSTPSSTPYFLISRNPRGSSSAAAKSFLGSGFLRALPASPPPNVSVSFLNLLISLSCCISASRDDAPSPVAPHLFPSLLLLVDRALPRFATVAPFILGTLRFLNLFKSPSRLFSECGRSLFSRDSLSTCGQWLHELYSMTLSSISQSRVFCMKHHPTTFWRGVIFF